jgi:S-layer protein
VLTLADSSGSSDTLTVKLKAAAAFTSGTITAAGIETVNLVLDDTTATSSTAGAQFTSLLTVAAATSLVVSGDAAVALTLTGSTALTSVNTSGVTSGTVNITTVGLAATTFTGGNTATTVSIAAATAASTVTTGTAADAVTGGSSNDTITTSSGNDTILGGLGNDTINAGSGTDSITGGGGADSLTGGDGADSYVYTSAAATDSNGVNQDTITDFVTGTDKFLVTTNTGTGVYAGEAAGYGAVLTALSTTNDVAVLDTTTNILYIDVNHSGTLTAADITIKVTGVTDLASGDFTFA